MESESLNERGKDVSSSHGECPTDWKKVERDKWEVMEERDHWWRLTPPAALVCSWKWNRATFVRRLSSSRSARTSPLNAVVDGRSSRRYERVLHTISSISNQRTSIREAEKRRTRTLAGGEELPLLGWGIVESSEENSAGRDGGRRDDAGENWKRSSGQVFGRRFSECLSAYIVRCS